MTEIAKAYVQIIPTTKGIKGTLEKEMDESGGSAGEKGGASAGSGFLKGVGGAIAKGAAVLGAAAVAGTTAIAKSAVDAYADYEQLVGGVETLFKDSAGVVQEYAANAFQTAGLSANDYMETVTSFSASLLQSVGGDTAAAAQIADMAITDMADNANKMGSSIESIQNAYQGFAKQNYTMLDNLKLGYGGTKTEMERLLKDATALSGIEYDIESLSDVYSAINVIQTELGITGTTAAEASSTISGSASAMKSAWENALVAIADENADAESSIQNLVESAKTFGENIIPRIEQVAGGIARFISGIAPVMIAELPSLVNTVLPEMVNAFTSIVNSLAKTLPAILPPIIAAMVDFFIGSLPMIIDAGLELLTGLVGAMPEIIDGIVKALPQIISSVIDFFIGSIPLLVGAGVQLLVALVENMPDIIKAIVDRLPEIITAITNTLADNIPLIIAAGVDLLTALVTNIDDIIIAIVGAIPSIISSIVQAFANGIPSLEEVGKNLIYGLWNGMLSVKDWLLGKVSSLMGSVTSTTRTTFGVFSPSKVFAEIGGYLAEGLGNGFEDEMKGVKQDMTADMDNLITTLNGASASFNATITPGAGEAKENRENNERLIAALRDMSVDVKVLLDSREIKAGQGRLARAVG